MIPDEAVEAAASIIYRTSGRRRVMTYEQAREACESEARTILEAAAPHIVAQAWEEGFDKGEDFTAWSGGLDAYKPDFTNPYRAIVQTASGQTNTTERAEIDDDPDMGEPTPPAHRGEDVVEMSHPTIDWSITTIRKNVRVYLDDGWYLVDDTK